MNSTISILFRRSRPTPDLSFPAHAGVKPVAAPVANQWINRFSANGSLVVGTQNWHPANHVSFITQNPGSIRRPAGHVSHPATSASPACPGFVMGEFRSFLDRGFWSGDCCRDFGLLEMLRPVGNDWPTRMKGQFRFVIRDSEYITKVKGARFRVEI